MSIFGNIMSSIFGHAKAQTTQAAPPASGKTSGPAPSTAGATSGPASTSAGTAASDTANTPAAPGAAQPQVDVDAVLTELTRQKKEKLDWRRSIVDLMKLLDLDSSLSARKDLAKELHYTGDTNDLATMNIWLHKQVMIKLAENGGKVPNSLKG